MKEIMAALKEFGEVVENFESKAEMKGCLRRHFQDGTGAEVEARLFERESPFKIPPFLS